MYQAEWLIYRRRKPRQRSLSLNVSMYMILPSIELADTQYDLSFVVPSNLSILKSLETHVKIWVKDVSMIKLSILITNYILITILISY